MLLVKHSKFALNIASLLQADSLGQPVGIFTNARFWNDIFGGNYTVDASKYKLWWEEHNGQAVSSEQFINGAVHAYSENKEFRSVLEKSD